MSLFEHHVPEAIINPLYTPGHPEFGVSVMYDRILLVQMAHSLFTGSRLATYAEMFALAPTDAELAEPSRRELSENQNW